MATSAEVISTKFFHAMGYSVAQDYIVYFSRDQIELSPKAEFEDLVGKTRPMKEKDFDEILARAWKGADGKYRAVASKFILGKFVGDTDTTAFARMTLTTLFPTSIGANCVD